jgi:predicted ATP-grasp superfamily ATP-dependent carboligase
MLTSRQRRANYITLFSSVDEDRLNLLQLIYQGNLTEETVNKLQDLNEIAECIITSIEENGVLDGN